MDDTYPQNQIAYEVPVQTQVNEETKYRIKMWMAWALLVTAICIDLAELVITWLGFIVVGSILSEILSVAASALFYVWFLMLGVPASSNTKQFAVRIATVIIEIIPGFDAIPLLSWAWTFGMIFTIVLTRMEDEGEKPTLTGAMGRVASFGSPVTLVEEKVKSNVKRRVFPKPQKTLENRQTNATMEES